MNDDHIHHMRRAIEQAREAGRQGNRPVASIIVRDDAIIGEGQNTILTDCDPSAHAEVAAIRQACGRLRTVDLSGSTLYSTLEPCPMCFWAMQEARIGRLVLGGRYAGIGRTNLGRYTVESFLEFTGRSLEVVTGVLAGECEAVRLKWVKGNTP
jgi:tRNA(adenine34) deaminase